MDSWLSIAGSIASIGAAVWSFREAQKSLKHANKAKEFHDEIIKRRELIEVSHVHTETQRILKIISQVGPSCSSSSIRGISCENIAKEVEEYSRFLNEQSSHFSEHFDNKAKQLCSELTTYIESLSEAQDFESIKSAGKTIYYKINSFMPEVKRINDEKKEQGPIA